MVAMQAEGEGELAEMEAVGGRLARAVDMAAREW